jgi:uncharacterized pyridoxamine 5'-phosphate oxidase family protein
MKEVVQFLQENSVQYFATIGKDNRPKVRPFQFMLERDGKLFFCTSNLKEVYSEMMLNNDVEICVSSPKFEWMRLSGSVCFVNDLIIKQAIFEISPLVKSIYKSPENPIFEVFYLKDAKAVIADFSGNPPRTLELL